MLKDVHQAEIRDNKHCKNIKVFVKLAGYYKYTFKIRLFWPESRQNSPYEMCCWIAAGPGWREASDLGTPSNHVA